MGGYDTIANDPGPDRRYFAAPAPVDRAVVEALQRSLLPAILPATPGIEIAGRWQPASDDRRVGGDWYDAFAMPDGKLFIAVGDVAGPGVAAASTMGRMRTALQVYAFEGYSPRQMLERLNRHAFETGSGEVATMLLVVLDPAAETAVCASAGHPPPVLRDPSGTVSLAGSAGGPPIGASARARFEEHDIAIEAGSTLLLYTDGLVEFRGEDLGEGIARLMRKVEQGPAGAHELAEHLLETCAPSGATDDDVALMIAVSDRDLSPLQLDIAARPRVLRFVRNAVALWLHRAGIDDGEACDLLLAVNEAVANAVEHAYGPGDGEVHLFVERDGQDVYVVVRDDGRWRSFRPLGGGLGMDLMRRLVDDASIIRGPNGTTVRLRMRLGRSQSADREGGR